MRCALLPGLALLVWAPSFAAGSGAFDRLDQCVARLDPELDIGYDRIAARCPELTRSLEASGWSAWLPSDWKRPGNDLSAASLAELRRLAARELATHRGGQVLGVERLDAVLAELGQPGSNGVGHRWLAWLHALLGRPEDPDNFGQAFERVGLSDAPIELLARAGLAVIVALAVLIVLKELHLAGVMRWPLRAPQRWEETPGAPRAGWLDIQQAPRERQPRLLLALLAKQLTEQSRLPASRGMTARELMRAARLPEEDDRRRLGAVAQVAESLCYSDKKPGLEHIEAALEQGRELHEQLSQAGPQSPRVAV
jgi:hypothetical protein